jgi:hypothetical protein
MCGLPDATAAESSTASRAGCSGDHGRALVRLPKQGSWFALATPITDFQRQHRRNVETGCRGGTEGGEVTAEECCIAPRCRVEPFLDQGGAAARHRVRRSPCRAQPWEARPARPRRPSRTVPLIRDGLSGTRPGTTHALFVAADCPSRGSRVRGALRASLRDLQGREYPWLAPRGSLSCPTKLGQRQAEALTMTAEPAARAGSSQCRRADR